MEEIVAVIVATILVPALLIKHLTERILKSNAPDEKKLYKLTITTTTVSLLMVLRYFFLMLYLNALDRIHSLWKGYIQSKILAKLTKNLFY